MMKQMYLFLLLACLFSQTVFGQSLSQPLADSPKTACDYLPGTVTVSGIGTDEATLHWGAATQSMGYYIYLNNDSSWSFNDTNFFTLSTLTPNTVYTGYVYNICSGANYSNGVPFSFQTRCPIPGLPHYESFDSCGAEFPECWSRYEYGNSPYYPGLTSLMSRSGQAVFLHDNTLSNSFASPYMQVPINEVETRFWARVPTNAYAASIQVGYVSDLDTGTFVPVATFPLTDRWVEYEVSFASTGTTESGYIIYRKLPGTNAYVYLDDFSFLEAVPCSNPTQFHVTSTDRSEVSFAWSDTNSYGWEIAYGYHGFDPDTTLFIEAFGYPYGTISGLDDTAIYDFYLRSNCGSSMGYSHWIGPIATPANLITLGANTTDTITACAATVVDDGGLWHTAALHQSSILVIVPDGPDKVVALEGTASASGYFTDFYTGIDVFEGTDTNGRLLGSFSYYTTPNINVVSSTGPLTIHYTTGYVVEEGFRLHVSCQDMPSCTTPWEVNVSEITSDSALVHWHHDNETEPDYFLVTVTDTLTGDILSFTAAGSDRALMVNGLDQNTVYRVSVEAQCVDTTSSHRADTLFITPCFMGGGRKVGDSTANLILYPFDTYNNTSICQFIVDASEIDSLSDTITGVKFFMNDGPHVSRMIDVYIDSTSRSSYMLYTDYILMDTTHRYYSDDADFHPGWVEFRFLTPYIRSSSSSNLVITVVDNTFRSDPYSYWAGTNNRQGKTVFFISDTYIIDPAATPIIMYLFEQRPDVYLMAPCADTVCYSPETVRADVTDTGATLRWEGYSSAYVVQYQAVGDSLMVTDTVESDSLVLSSLMPATSYQFRVRGLCSGRSSCWSDTLFFTTTFCPAVTGLRVGGVSYDAVEILWDEVARIQSWRVEFGPYGFSRGEGTTVVVDTNAFRAEGLHDDMPYDFYVQSICSLDSASDHWSQVWANTLPRPIMYYEVTLTVNDSTMGYVSGGGQYEEGESVTIQAIPYPEYQFRCWSDSITAATRQLTVTRDIYLQAIFEPIGSQGIGTLEVGSFSLAPNPASSLVTLTLEGVYGIVKATLLDFQGRTVLTAEILCDGSCSQQLDVSALPRGTYLLCVSAPHFSRLTKLIK